MALSMYVEVEYEGTDKILIRSPVFDTINLPVELPGKVIGGGAALSFITFFLVYQDDKKNSLMWIKMERCKIVKDGFNTKGR